MDKERMMQIVIDADEEFGETHALIIPQKMDGFAVQPPTLVDSIEGVEKVMLQAVEQSPIVHILTQEQHITFTYQEGKGWSHKTKEN